MFCTKCGAQIADNAKFCPKCGAQIIAVSNPDEAKYEERFSEQETEHERYTSKSRDRYEEEDDRYYDRPVTKKPNKMLPIVIIIAAAAVAAVLVFFFFFRGGSGSRVDLNEYLSVEFSGTDGSGYASGRIDKDRLISDHPELTNLSDKQRDNIINELSGGAMDALGQYGDLMGDLADSIYSNEDLVKYVLDDAISGSLDETGNLSTGDTVRFTWDVDESMLQSLLNLNVSYEDQDFTVEVEASEEAYSDNNSNNNNNNGSNRIIPNNYSSSEDEQEGDGADEEEDDSNIELSGSVNISTGSDTSGCHKVNIIKADASSVIEQEGYDNTANMAVDGNEITSWQEGVNGYGKDEWVSFTFDKEEKIRCLKFKMGNWRDQKNYDVNNRPKQVTVWLGDQSFKATFPDGKDEFTLKLTKDVKCSDVTVRIDSVYKGSEYDDTCISEIGIYAVD